MKFLKKEEIRWDIVKKASWPRKLGWPLTTFTATGKQIIRAGNMENGISKRPYIEIRIPFSHTITYKIFDSNGDILPPGEEYPTISHRTIRLVWMGILWFWRTDL